MAGEATEMETSVDHIPIHPSQVTPAWLTDCFSKKGIVDAASVASLSYESIGAGMVGDSIRFTLSYDDNGRAGPATLVGKFPAEDQTSRETGVALGLYLNEVGYYRELSHTVAVRTPHPYYAAINEATGDFLLLLEDLGPARGGNQLKGCSLEDAEHVMRQAAALHGPRWNDPALRSIEWLNARPRHLKTMQGIFPAALRKFQERYDGILEPDLMAVCTRFGEKVGDFCALEFERFCVIHGDLRLDNLLFDILGEQEPLAVLDWQTAARAMGMVDVGYFLGAGIQSELRRAHERDLIRLYLDELRRHGVTDYGWDNAWTDYRRGMLQGVIMPIFASANVERTERGDEMFLSMARGACQLAIDVEAFDALRAA